MCTKVMIIHTYILIVSKHSQIHHSQALKVQKKLSLTIILLNIWKIISSFLNEKLKIGNRKYLQISLGHLAFSQLIYLYLPTLCYQVNRYDNLQCLYGCFQSQACWYPLIELILLVVFLCLCDLSFCISFCSQFSWLLHLMPSCILFMHLMPLTLVLQKCNGLNPFPI